MGRPGFLKRVQQLALPSLAPFSPLLTVPGGRVNPPSTPSLTGTAEGGNPSVQGWGVGGHPGARLPPASRFRQLSLPASCGGREGGTSVKRSGRILPRERDPFSARYQCGFSSLPPSPAPKGFTMLIPAPVPAEDSKKGMRVGEEWSPICFSLSWIGSVPSDAPRAQNICSFQILNAACFLPSPAAVAAKIPCPPLPGSHSVCCPGVAGRSSVEACRVIFSRGFLILGASAAYG